MSAEAQLPDQRGTESSVGGAARAENMWREENELPKGKQIVKEIGIDQKIQG